MGEIKKCPKCGSSMVVRTNRSDNSKFWGCAKYPNCRGTVNIPSVRHPANSVSKSPVSDGGRIPIVQAGEAPIIDNVEARPTTEWKPSPQQLAVFEAVRSGTGHLVVKAGAGTGKTTTTVKSLDVTPKSASVAFVAFNVKVAKILDSRAPEHVHVSTLHSLGNGNIKRAYPRSEMDADKMSRMLKAYGKSLDGQQSAIEKLRVSRSTILRLVSMCKGLLREPTLTNLQYISDRYDISLSGDVEFIQFVVERLYRHSIDNIADAYDYDDMIYASASGVVACRQFDYLFVDEAQDLNSSQIQMVLRSVKPGGRIVAIGDENQSIYGFRGADTEAMSNLIRELNATVLPLSVTYRCPKSHVKLANELVPELQAADWAEEGVVDNVGCDAFLGMVKPGDLVLCRTNAPLVSPAFKLISRGVKAVILGRDIGEGLKELIHKMTSTSSLIIVLADLRRYVDDECAKLVAVEKTLKAASLRDRFDTIVALSEGCQSVFDLEARIDKIFQNEEEGAVFSTVHKAKGGEADNVFILRRDLMPHPSAKSDWEQVQERNIRYVALTRAKKSLHFVAGGS